VRTAIHKQTYSGGRAYRYRVLDEAGQLCCVAEPTGLLLPTPTRLVEFFDSDHELVGRLQPSDVASWRRVKRYELFVAKEAEAAGRRAAKPREARGGQIQRPAAGPSYVVETDATPLRRALTVLAAVMILIDLELTA